ncbi:ORF113 [Lymantria xylina nucleopolyhedrovirus]|uniref:ORF113 n=1 Tax=Lymantria xylina multiple nucleopolyhedrovirus TaxID=2847840 RepID=D4N2F0_9ABAC|nr:ORF113 [Lymantria xylina nucleopolyhedrovirus]ADD73822.1 ORF113 [Lymantria xylina nucleopolyhedrovirus]
MEKAIVRYARRRAASAVDVHKILGDVVWAFVYEGFVGNGKLRSMALRSAEERAEHAQFVDLHKRKVCRAALKQLFARHCLFEMTRADRREVTRGLRLLSACRCVDAQACPAANEHKNKTQQ